MNVKEQGHANVSLQFIRGGLYPAMPKAGERAQIVDGLAAQASSRDRRPEVSHSRPHGRTALVAAAECAGVARYVARMVNYCIANMPGAVPRTSTFAQ
jgi:hypothetical protein